MFWSGIGASFIFLIIGYSLLNVASHFRADVGRFIFVSISALAFGVSFFALVAVGWTLLVEVFRCAGWC